MSGTIRTPHITNMNLKDMSKRFTDWTVLMHELLFCNASENIIWSMTDSLVSDIFFTILSDNLMYSAIYEWSLEQFLIHFEKKNFYHEMNVSPNTFLYSSYLILYWILECARDFETICIILPH